MVRKVFIGERELTRVYSAKDFKTFESLPFIRLIRKMAAQFWGSLEIMPYQRQGEPVKLALSVYLKPKTRGGRIIVILTKEDYPQDGEALTTLVRKARTRIETMTKRATEFDARSLSVASTKVDELVSLVINAIH